MCVFWPLLLMWPPQNATTKIRSTVGSGVLRVLVPISHFGEVGHVNQVQRRFSDKGHRPGLLAEIAARHRLEGVALGVVYVGAIRGDHVDLDLLPVRRRGRG